MSGLVNDDNASMGRRRNLRELSENVSFAAFGSTTDYLKGPLVNGFASTAMEDSKENVKPSPKKIVESSPKTQTIMCIADDLICPITLELPFDPVKAEDGCVYDRWAIEKHFYGKPHNKIRSPMTNLPMGTVLQPAINHKNLIQKLIDSGVLAGNMAEVWNEKIKKANAMKWLVRRAKYGDGHACYSVGRYHWKGENGARIDYAAARKWYQKSHEAGYVAGTAVLATCLLLGFGGEPSTSDGLYYLTKAAYQGSDYAAFVLGIALARGDFGLQRNTPEAILWLEQASSSKCTHKHLVPAYRAEARRMLEELGVRSKKDY